MELYATLNPKEKEKLLQFPVYISLLAANADGELDDREKQKANDIAQIKNYDSKEPILIRYYEEVAAVFEHNLNHLDSILPKDKDEREAAIRQQFAELEGIVNKLGTQYNNALHRSLQSFKEHVSKAHQNTLEGFFFPFPIKGLTE